MNKFEYEPNTHSLLGFLYEYNIASEVAGGNGCDPPWVGGKRNVKRLLPA